MVASGRVVRLTRTLRGALGGLLDQSQPFGRLALVHSLFSAAWTMVAISLAGSLFFSVTPADSKGRVLVYLIITIVPFALVAPALSPILDRGTTARRASIAVACGGSAVLAFMMSGNLEGFLLFPEAFGILVLSKLYLVGKAALVPTMTSGDDDLASANAKLTVLASLAGFAIAPVGVSFLQLGASWDLRIDFLVFVAAAVASSRLPLSIPTPARARPLAMTADGRPIEGPAVPTPPPAGLLLPGGPGGLVYGKRSAGSGELGAGPHGEARPGRRARLDVRAERRRLGLPLVVPEVTVALLAMTVLRSALGFMTFFLAFGLRERDAATWWYGVVLLACALGAMLGSLLVPALRRWLSEQQIITASLLVVALFSLLSGWSGSLDVQPFLALAVGCASTSAKPAFDSIAQRNVPPAALGRAFARFETQLQLAWVVCGIIAVVISFSFRSGDFLIATACAVAAVFHFSLRRSYGTSRRPRATAPGRLPRSSTSPA